MAEMNVTEDWHPTPENINALPEPVRDYIIKLHTLCDPAGIVRENVLLRDEVSMLRRALMEEEKL